MAVFEHVFEVRARAREALARSVNAPPDQVAVTTSTSNGVGIVIGGIDWNPGDEVITTTEESAVSSYPLVPTTRELYPQIGPACVRSKAFPCGTPSIISTRIMS